MDQKETMAWLFFFNPVKILNLALYVFFYNNCYLQDGVKIVKILAIK